MARFNRPKDEAGVGDGGVPRAVRGAKCKVRVVYPSELWSFSKLLVVSFVVGILDWLAVVAFMAIAIINLGPFLNGGATILGLVYVPRAAALIAIPLVGIPVVFLYRFRHTIHTARRSMIVGLGCGFGAMFPVVALRIGVLSIPFLLWSLLVAVILVVFFGAASVISQLLIRSFRGEIVLQDGTLCPNCAYCLIGNTTMICPECGVPYTYDDLDTTTGQFRDSAKGMQ